jgi:uncharacterized membrane protein
MKKLLFIAAIALCFTLSPAISFAQVGELAMETPAPDTYYRARVLKILDSGNIDVDGVQQYHQKAELEILNGDEKGKHITIDHGAIFAIQDYQKIHEGDVVVVNKPGSQPVKDFYYITDKYRLPNLLILISVFFVLACFFGKKRGLTSILGLVFTTGVIFWFLIPRIAGGANPLTTGLVAALITVFFSLYLLHGFNRRTSIALMSTLLALGAAVALDLMFVWFAKLSGTL